MNSAFKSILAAAALLSIAGCVSAGGPVYYNGYYDGYYGPLYDGYWGDDNIFYHAGGRGQPFIPDQGNHFQRSAAPGLSSFHNAHTGPHAGHPHDPSNR
jgi:hypothetical protein